MRLFSRLLQAIPEVRRLREERDALRSDGNSMRLKVRAASAEMGVLEEQERRSQIERDQLSSNMARQAGELASRATQLEDALATNEAAKQELDRLTKALDALNAEYKRLVIELDDLVGVRDASTLADDARAKPVVPE